MTPWLHIYWPCNSGLHGRELACASMCVSTVSKVRTIFEAMTDFSHVEMDVMFIRHAESQNNALYEQIREELGHDISEEELDREESVRRNPDPCITQLGKRC